MPSDTRAGASANPFDASLLQHRDAVLQAAGAAMHEREPIVGERQVGPLPNDVLEHRGRRRVIAAAGNPHRFIERDIERDEVLGIVGRR